MSTKTLTSSNQDRPRMHNWYVFLILKSSSPNNNAWFHTQHRQILDVSCDHLISSPSASIVTLSGSIKDPGTSSISRLSWKCLESTTFNHRLYLYLRCPKFQWSVDNPNNLIIDITILIKTPPNVSIDNKHPICLLSHPLPPFPSYHHLLLYPSSPTHPHALRLYKMIYPPKSRSFTNSSRP